MERVGIIIAVEAEAHAVLTSGELGFIRQADRIWSSSKYPFDLALSGVGKVLASHALMSLENSGDHAWYWSLGTSGSLGTEPVGSMYLCTRFVEWDMDIRPLGFPRGVTAYESEQSPFYETMSGSQAERFYEITGSKRALAISGDSFIAEEALSRNLLTEFDIGLPIVVDMESAAIAKLCALRIRKPYCALRWVSDNANKESGNNWKENVMRASSDFAKAIERVGKMLLG